MFCNEFVNLKIWGDLGHRLSLGGGVARSSRRGTDIELEGDRIDAAVFAGVIPERKERGPSSVKGR